MEDDENPWLVRAANPNHLKKAAEAGARQLVLVGAIETINNHIATIESNIQTLETRLKLILSRETEAYTVTEKPSVAEFQTLSDRLFSQALKLNKLNAALENILSRLEL